MPFRGIHPPLARAVADAGGSLVSHPAAVGVRRRKRARRILDRMAEVATQEDLRGRLRELTLRDAHRLKRRLDRVRRHPDPAALRKLEADVERAETRVAKR